MIGQTDSKPNVSQQQCQAEAGLTQSATAPFKRKEKDEDSASITVSIVDADAPTRETLADWIKHAHGFRCVGMHGSGESALAALPAEKPAIVLMDINLPGMNGIECVRLLKALLPETQFIILTVYGDSDHIFNALAAGASGYLLKRTPRLDLLASIKQVHDGGSPITSDIARKVLQSFQLPKVDKLDPGILSPRELEVLALLARGFTYREIANSFHISESTVNTYGRRIYKKLHVRSRAKAVATYMQFIYGGKFWRKSSNRSGSVDLPEQGK